MIVRERSQIVDVHVHQTSFACPTHDPVSERAGKKVRENRDDIELHSGLSVPQPYSGAIQIPQPFGKQDIDAFGTHVDALAKLRRQRNENFALAG